MKNVSNSKAVLEGRRNRMSVGGLLVKENPVLILHIRKSVNYVLS